MATISSLGTSFTLSVLENSGEFWLKVRLCAKNEYIFYEKEGEWISREELETLLACVSRLLAGGYEREQTVAFEKAGLAVDLYAHTKDGISVSREERRQNDCIMAVRILMRSKDDANFFGGVYSLLFHRKETEKFVEELREEYAKNCTQHIHGGGKYLFVGVSPKGYRGCNYWYFDPSGTTKAGEYVWVRMGRHNTEQVVYVDSVRFFDDDNAPFAPKRVKQILRKAKEDEI